MAKKKKQADKRKEQATCFVLMPFSPTRSCKDWDSIYKNLISPAIRASGFGYKPERSQIRTGAFIRDILVQINTASVVLADLTDVNPNVFYELGVRHTLKNRTILVAQDIKHVPSDLRAYGVVIYTPDLNGLPKFKKKLRQVFQHIEKEPNRPDNPVSDYIKNRAYLLYEHDRLDAIRRLKSLHAEIFENRGALGFNIMEFDNPDWDLVGFSTSCLEEILSTQYVNLSFEDYYKLRLLLISTNDIDYIGKQCLVHAHAWRKTIKKLYLRRGSDVEKMSRESAEIVQSRIGLLSKEDYTAEPPQPVYRAVIWEIYLAEKKKLEEKAEKKSSAKKATAKKKVKSRVKRSSKSKA